MRIALSLIATLSASLAAPLAATAAPRVATTFIVLCDVATPAQRKGTERAIARAGGRIVYRYTAIGGFAVAAADARAAPRLEQRLRRLPGVVSVEPDRMVELHGPG